jgi:DNA mismatch endonuclease, patch repair protein
MPPDTKRHDPLTPKQRRYTMSRVRSEGTAPETYVRRLVHSLGYRYRLHRRDLPGKPDLVFPGRGRVILVHGCFWHGHDCEAGKNVPKSNQHYWLPKLARNRARDLANQGKLRDLGWSVLVLWECELGDEAVLRAKVTQFLEDKQVESETV